MQMLVLSMYMHKLQPWQLATRHAAHVHAIDLQVRNETEATSMGAAGEGLPCGATASPDPHNAQ